MKEIVYYYPIKLEIINRNERMNCRMEPTLIKSRKIKNSTRRLGSLTTHIGGNQRAELCCRQLQIQAWVVQLNQNQSDPSLNAKLHF